MMIDAKGIDKIFQALDRQVGIHGGSPYAIVVCGGTALAAMGLILRTTRDVDVLGEVVVEEQKINVKRILDFPSPFIEAAAVVKRDFGLPEYWINKGPTFQVELGLPGGLEERLIRKVYGGYLTVYFISRLDQIYFKLLASLDLGRYHVDDLLDLKPSNDEMLKAIAWVLSQEDWKELKKKLYKFLEKWGFNDIIAEL